MIPENVAKIADRAFAHCEGLTGVIIPESVRDIGKYAFANCIALTHVHIPEGVTWIDKDAFAGYTGFVDMTIPKSVEYIGSGAFSDTNLAKKTIQAAYDQAEKTEMVHTAEALLEYIFSDNGATIICKIYRLSFQT